MKTFGVSPFCSAAYLSLPAEFHQELLPFFWSANGITSMLASVLGMALSIEFGIAKTYAIGVAFYAVCVHSSL